MICLLGRLTTFSQTDYPKTIELNGDTVTIFHFWQAKEIAKELTQKDYLVVRTQLDSLDLSLLEDLAQKLKTLSTTQESVIIDYQTIITNQEEVILLQKDIIAGYNKENKKRKWRNAGIISGLGAGLITTLILLR